MASQAYAVKPAGRATLKLKESMVSFFFNSDSELVAVILNCAPHWMRIVVERCCLTAFFFDSMTLQS
jgi:hypothetical protein